MKTANSRLHLPNHHFHGILILDKAAGLSSQQAVTQVKRRLQVKKAGHTGTLDPLATGVLPIAVGEATKAIPYLEENEKTYELEAKFGASTTTYDAEGEIVHQVKNFNVTLLQVQALLTQMTGRQMQTPPIYSALKLQGKPLYRYARVGENVSVKAREVELKYLQILDFTPPYLRLQVTCSKGTYIRSLVHDLGQKLGCWAHMTQLRRTQSGPYELKNSIVIEKISPEALEDQPYWLGLDQMFSSLPSFEICEEENFARLQNGLISYALQEQLAQKWASQAPVGPRWVLSFQGQVVALLKITGTSMMKLERLFKTLEG